MFWNKKKKIQLFVRHCNYSEVSGHKGRLPGFSREKCHENLLETVDRSLVDITFILDTFHPAAIASLCHFAKQSFPSSRSKKGARQVRS